MNAIRQTQQLNKRELENATPPSASWHADYRDTAWVYIGGIPLDLSEGDVVIIFSQFGNPTHLNLIRDRETGKSKGFGFLKYEDQRSCDLAVDNLTGADVLGRMLRVDHTRYKKKDDEDEDTWRIERLEAEQFGESGNGNGKRASDTEESDDERTRRKKPRPMLKEEKELEQMLAIKENGEEEDPMKDYLIQEKREELKRARDREDRRDRKRRHRGDAHEDRERGHHRSKEQYPDDREDNRTEKRKRTSRRERSESVDSDGDVIKRSIEVDDRPNDKSEVRRRDRDGKGERSTKHRRDSTSSDRNLPRPGSRDRDRQRQRKSRSRSKDRSQGQRSSKRRYS